MQTDVVVIGGGGSGLAAAIGAANSGARVVLLEKNRELGGTTAWSVGSISASQTPHQKRMGIVDSPDEHFEDMGLFSKQFASRPDNDALCRILADNVPETIRWLSAMGIEFLGPMHELPHRKPRMHNVLPNSRAYIFHLGRHARRAGVEILTNARAQRFVMSGGHVAGVEFERSDGRAEVVHAARGVVLASGDYAANPDMKREFISPAAAATEPINPTSTGDGQRMALELGARIINADLFSGGMRFVRPAQPSWISRLPPMRWLMRPANLALRWSPKSMVRRFIMGFLTTVMVPVHELFTEGALLINKNGERFADETRAMVFDLAYQPDGTGYIVFDAQLAEKFSRWPYYISTAPGIAFAYLADYEKNRPDLFHRGQTPEALSIQLGIKPASLKATIERYNASNEESNSGARISARGKRPALLRGPYYALGPVKNYISFTDGGLAISERLEVLDASGTPIPRLFAAGSAGQGGLLLKGHGNHLGWGFTSGRLAGKYAANLPPRSANQA